MFRTQTRTAMIASTIIALLGVALVAPTGTASGAVTRSAIQGVTDDEIQIVAIVPDLEELRASGAPVSRTTPADYEKRSQLYADAFGPINGRKVVVKQVGWNPIDPTSLTKACAEATQNTEPFAVVHQAGYQMSAVPCITVDNKTPFITGDPGYKIIQKASGNRLVTLGIGAEVMGTAAANYIDGHKAISKKAKIGILSNNEPAVKAAGDSVEARLKKLGYNVVSKVELNGLAADFGLLNRESSAAADTMKAKGVDTVINANSFLSVVGFWQEAQRTGMELTAFAFDGQAGACNLDGARFAPSEVNIKCLSFYGTRALPDKSGIRPDTPFEAKCREQFDKAFNEKSYPGVPNGDYEAGGVTYVEDFAEDECTIMNLLLPAMKKAGKNLTWDKTFSNLMKVTNGDVASHSDGHGSFSKNKPYFYDQVHIVERSAASANTPVDANGTTFNGCPIPRSCWIPVLTDGKEWFKAQPG